MSDEIGKRSESWAELKASVGCSLYEAEKIAEEHLGSNIKMTMLTKAGAILRAEWLDPSFGLFILEGEDKFISTNQVRKLGLELWVMSMVDGDGKSIPLRAVSGDFFG